MVKTVCDRCNKEVKSYECEKYLFYEKRTKIINREDLEEYELCNECSNMLKCFLKGAM